MESQDDSNPGSSTASSSSISSGEQLQQRTNRITDLLEEAVHVLYELEQEETSSARIRRGNINREAEAANERLMRDYFSNDTTYNDESFRRRFRMSRRLFERIVNDLEAEYHYFQLRWDARGKKGLTPIQKCHSAIRQLAYGVSGDGLDDYLRMGEKTSRDSLNNFCTGIIHLYARQYLRKPTFEDIQQLYVVHEARHGFPGMLGSLDCTHWAWKNCPVAWRGQFMRGDHERPTVMLEAVASYDLWIWHAFFGVAGSNNDLNVLNQSSIFNHVYEETAPDSSFEVNQVRYKHGYYLVDGIYPEWATFVKAFTCPNDAKRQKFKAAQESARKDIERAFGVLKKRWEIIEHPGRALSLGKLKKIMYTCIILHNMIIEDDGNAICSFNPEAILVDDIETEISEERRAENVREIRNRDTHNNLRSDLVEHIWRTNLPENEEN